MPKLIELTTTPKSGYYHIDALLNSSPDWNYYQPTVANTLFYTFVVHSDSEISDVSNLTAFTPTQQAAANLAIAELAKYTGINFVQTTDTNLANIALVNGNILKDNTMGLAAWSYGYDELPNGEFTNYIAGGTLYMDSVEFGQQNANLSPGTRGYETLLHELGHLMGLKHPFDAKPDNTTTLPAGQDGAFYTVMSYSTFSAPGQTYAQYDIAALRWLYGGDGLGGARGASEGSGKYLVGTPFVDNLLGSALSDMFEGGYGNDNIDGGAGTDFVKIDVARHLMTLTKTATGWSLDDGVSVDQLVNVERVLYDGGAIALDVNGTAGQAYRVYNAAFDRAPDAAGVGFWIAQMDKGVPLHDIAHGFMQSNEFVTMYGANPTNEAFVAKLYQNVLDRAGEQAGVDFWVAALNEGRTDHASVLAHFSESAENVANIATVIGNSFPYIPYG
ncbi:DUF4214 domain-containing protein [Pseudoduganella sp. GCM10020061]|uniref:DUF4214 domain-containing protein n=1 Tax=Pseudoduganella sp. GCM10020061 TaxID=3317345 RepID=UPI00363EF013